MKKTNWEKLYVASSTDREALKANNKEFGHHYISIGYAADYGQPTHFWNSRYSITFQFTVNPSGEYAYDAYAYAGKVDCGIEYAAAAGKLITKVLATAEELAPNEPCPYKRFLVGLRGLGYRQPEFGGDGSEIINTH